MSFAWSMVDEPRCTGPRLDVGLWGPGLAPRSAFACRPKDRTTSSVATARVATRQRSTRMANTIGRQVSGRQRCGNDNNKGSEGHRRQQLRQLQMPNGSITLGDVAARASHFEVACSRCERRERYHLARLVAALGADFRMTDLGSELANCPRRERRRYMSGATSISQDLVNRSWTATATTYPSCTALASDTSVRDRERLQSLTGWKRSLF
jgi:hypothetical protein